MKFIQKIRIALAIFTLPVLADDAPKADSQIDAVATKLEAARTHEETEYKATITKEYKKLLTREASAVKTAISSVESRKRSAMSNGKLDIANLCETRLVELKADLKQLDDGVLDADKIPLPEKAAASSSDDKTADKNAGAPKDIDGNKGHIWASLTDGGAIAIYILKDDGVAIRLDPTVETRGIWEKDGKNLKIKMKDEAAQIFSGISARKFRLADKESTKIVDLVQAGYGLIGSYNITPALVGKWRVNTVNVGNGGTGEYGMVCQENGICKKDDDVGIWYTEGNALVMNWLKPIVSSHHNMEFGMPVKKGQFSGGKDNTQFTCTKIADPAK